MLTNAEIAAIGRLQNPPEPLKAGGGVALHMSVENLGKENGRPTSAWIRRSVFDELAQIAMASFDKGDTLFLRGTPTWDKWHDRYSGAEKSGLSMIATEAKRLGVEMKSPAQVKSEVCPTENSGKPKRGRKALGMVGGLPKGGQPYSAVRIKPEDRSDWQRAIDAIDWSGLASL